MKKVSLLLIPNDDNEFLLFKRADNETTNPGKYGLLGGGVEVGESPDFAIKREVKEEAGVDLIDFSFLGTYIEGRNIIYVYYTKNFDFDSIKLNEEHSRYDWFGVEDIMSLDNILSTNKKFVSDYIKKHTINEVILNMKRLIK